MSGAIFALTVNVTVALLVALTFLIFSRTRNVSPGVQWFALSFAVGALTPLSEILVRATPFPGFFVATSFGTFCLAFLLMAHGLAVYYGTKLPRWLLPGMLTASLGGRAVMWPGPRNSLPYELLYQFPFALTLALGGGVILKASRHRPLDLLLAAMFFLVALHFLIKPFAAVTFGSGPTARDYIGSVYALISQSITGILLVGTALSLLLVVVRDMLDMAETHADRDMLSGLLNRRAFDREAAKLLASAIARKSRIAALMFDLDHFKAVNDTFGHPAGDAVIQAFARHLHAQLPSNAIIGRTGGEEFSVALPIADGAEHAAERVREAMALQTFPEIDPRLAVTVSCGITESTPDDTLRTLMVRSDSALYNAKRQGRDRVMAVA
ncbi:GGDEF domain-containing protein [Kaistia dalseonensis]|uniref:diguanylate cyclase n=1 Tax=Kaistia dalseonensis TaxID=410840 RepID=A0ABU0H763_9HYPH|nr:GGDEF domain-containing protein [Kaistia dalseonensis]MCX5495146.1 GGDEF domain-containing protein [Kaistia dalseonensis]MDQ0437728.1 diguanylate cyclase (GGDEF)-like protein [Kaistia dalseonensis]